MASVPPGRFRISAFGIAGNFPLPMFCKGATSVLTLGSGRQSSAAPLRFSSAVEPAGGQTVQDANMKPVPGSCGACPEEKRFENRTLFGNVTSDAVAFLVSWRLRQYRLLAWKYSTQCVSECGFIQKYDSRAQFVQIGQRATVHMDLKVIPAIEQR